MELQCEVCRNEYDKAFKVVMENEEHVFDCFECATHLFAPNCDHCGVKIIGHGVETDNAFYCSAHCAHMEGVKELKDRTTSHPPA